MKRLLANIMVVIACCILMLHAMIPHHNMSCGFDGQYVVASSVHYGMCEESDDCYKTMHHDYAIEGICGCSGHQGKDLGGHPMNMCKIQELLAQSIISSNEYDIYTAITCDAEFELFYDVIEDEAMADLLPIANGEWSNYVVKLPIRWVLSDAPLRAPPVC